MIAFTGAAIAPLDPWLSVVGVVLLVLSTADALLPTRYTLTTEGVRVRGAFSRKERPWSRFVGFREVREGFVLEGRGSRPVLRRHRTLLLRVHEDRLVVLAALRERLRPAEAACAT